MSKKAVVAGHICLDITPVFSESNSKSLIEIFSPGKIVQMRSVKLSAGGAVANTGLAMKKLGADVSLMGKIGSDEFGQMILSILDKYEASEGMIVVNGENSSYSVVIAAPGNDRMFLHCPGANDTYISDDLDEEKLRNVSLFHFGYPPIMKKMYQDDGKELVSLFKKVKSSECATSLDMASVDVDSDTAKADWKKIIEKVLPYVDFFVPSVEELCFMIDSERYIEWQKGALGRDIAETLDFEKDIKPIADKCMNMGCKVLLLKCGVKGLYLRTTDEEKLLSISASTGIEPKLWSDKSILERPYKPERILSATGAGDISIAAFLTAVLNEEGPENALKLASAAGASCLTEYDALSGLDSIESLKKKIDAGWEKI